MFPKEIVCCKCQHFHPSFLGSPANVSRRVLNSTSVQLTWYESFTPTNVTIERYTVSVFNTSKPQSHQLLEEYNDEGPPADSGLYSHTFNFDRGLTTCTQITFSVTSTSTIDTSPPSNVTWEMLVDKGIYMQTSVHSACDDCDSELTYVPACYWYN